MHAQHLASGSLDSSIIVWSVENTKSRTTLDGAYVVTLRGVAPNTLLLSLTPPFAPRLATAAHKDGVTVLGWLREQELVSSGNDAVILLWDLSK